MRHTPYFFDEPNRVALDTAPLDIVSRLGDNAVLSTIPLMAGATAKPSTVVRPPSAWVFPIDPISAGVDARPNRPSQSLRGARRTVTLANLEPPSGRPPYQKLRGTYVVVVDRNERRDTTEHRGARFTGAIAVLGIGLERRGGDARALPVGGGGHEHPQKLLLIPAALAQLDRTGGNVVRPQIERAAAGEVEAGVMPMTGQDAVLDAATVERKAHMRAAVVEGEDVPAIVDDQDRRVAAVHHEPPLGLQLGKATCAHKVRCRRIHRCIPIASLAHLPHENPHGQIIGAAAGN